jgi:hypothetical protein
VQEDPLEVGAGDFAGGWLEADSALRDNGPEGVQGEHGRDADRDATRRSTGQFFGWFVGVGRDWTTRLSEGMAARTRC